MAMPANRVSLVSDIKPDNRSRRGSRAAAPEHVRHRLALPLGIAAVLGGLALGAMAVPRLVAAIAVAQAQPIAERYVAGERGLVPADIGRAAGRLEFALSLAPDTKAAVLLADLRLWQARYAADTPALLAHAQQSVDAAKSAVRGSPAHPVAWAALAEALDLLTQGGEAVAAPLARSLMVAPYDPRRRDVRIELALRHWQALPPEAQRAAGPLIVAKARIDMAGLARVTKQNLGLGAVRAALAGDPALAQRFDSTYMALPN